MLPPFPAEVLVKRCQTGKKGKGLKDLKGWLPQKGEGHSSNGWDLE